LEKLGPRGETDPKVLLSQADAILQTSPEAGPQVSRHRDWASQAANKLPDPLFTRLPHTLIHGDIQPANLLVRDGRIAAFLDLDWCGWQARIYDLAYAFLFCCSTHTTPIEGGDIWSLTQPPIPQPNLFKDFLEVYEEAAAPLSREERAALPAQITLTWCHCRLAGALKVAPMDRATFLARPPHTLEELVYSIP
jgi:Ser/Thr protein kinase RdoA (MazF antagonist)